MGSLEYFVLAMTAASFCGYALLLAVIFSNGHLWTNTNRLIVALSMSDVLNLLSTTLAGFVGPVASLTEHNCIVLSTPALGFPLVSINLFLLVAVERYISVFYPLKYHSLLTWKRLMFFISVAFIFGFFVGVLPIIGWNNLKRHHDIGFIWTFNDCHQFLVLRGDYLALVHFITLVEAIVITILYVRILILARQLAKRIAAQRQSLTSQFRQNSVDSGLDAVVTDNVKVTVKRRTARGVKILLFLVIVYVVTKFPLKVCNAVQYRFFMDRTIYALNVPRAYYVTSIVLSQSNSVLYPFIYAFANHDIYEVLKRKLTCTKTLVISGANLTIQDAST